MNILILTTQHPYKTSGIVALDLYRALKTANGNDVRILTKPWDSYQDKSIIAINSRLEEYWKKLINLPKRILNGFRRELLNDQLKEKNKSNPDYHFQGIDQTITYCDTHKLLKHVDFIPDAIIVLFMTSFLSFKNLYELNQATNAPIFLCMMDMAPMTGGCHYAWDCDGYHNKCGKCQGLFSDKDNDLSRINWEFKKKYIDLTNLTAIAGTEYQYQQLQKSSLYAEKKKEKILLSIDPNLFKPGNKASARKYFGLPVKKKILFFGATNIKIKRKGFLELVQSLNILKTVNPNLELHIAIAGRAETELTTNIPFSYSILGHLNHENLAKAFQAADLFLCPSIEDSGPMMINQSIMSGTPVVAFEMGVALDLVISNKTGYLAKLKDSTDLAVGVTKILSLKDLDYKKMCENCRAIALKECAPEIQLSRLNDLIEN